MRTYPETIDFLFSLPSGGGEPQALDALLGHPSSAYPTVHVAGSNGKGSTATKIAKTLEYSGYRVGLYTSPHLFCFRERIQINCEMISEEAVACGIDKLLSFTQESTFFELATFLALDYFRQEKVDIAVIEVGIGGSMDCTNVIRPLVSVITSISKEHTDLLGEEIESIALQKAGIIKERTPVVVGPKARCQSIYRVAQEKHAPLFVSKKISYFFDDENRSIAELALEQLSPQFPHTLERGLLERPPCRFEEIPGGILDGAHNPEAMFALLQALHAFYPERKLRFLVGFCKDKDYRSCLELIGGVAEHIHLIQAPTPRAASPQELALCLDGDYTAHSSLEEGVHSAWMHAPEELIVVCGSFYLMDPVKRSLLCLTPLFSG
jgi:dihydrofolate synthase/folylpolyglutamate synthase